MTQILRQPLSEVRLWGQLPFDVFIHIMDMKQKAMSGAKKNSNNEYEADPYSEEEWLKQFGDTK